MIPAGQVNEAETVAGAVPNITATTSCSCTGVVCPGAGTCKGFCDVSSGCICLFPDASKSCGVICGSGSCDGNGACNVTNIYGAGTSCGGSSQCPFQCNGAGTGSANCIAVNQGLHCGDPNCGGTCNGSACTNYASTSTACKGSGVCAAYCNGAGACGSAASASQPCVGTGGTCSAYCDGNGACGATPAAGTFCAGTQGPCQASCDGAGSCGSYAPQSTVCGGSGVCAAYCTGSGACGAFPTQSTVCGGSGVCAAYCNGSGACGAFPTGSTVCSGSGSCAAVCNGSGTCGTFPNGSCTVSSDPQCGPGACANGSCKPTASSCTEAVDPKCQVGSCSANGTCSVSNLSDGTSCSSDACNPASCQAGKCTAGTPVACNSPPDGCHTASGATCSTVNGAAHCNYPVTSGASCTLSSGNDAACQAGQCNAGGTCVGPGASTACSTGVTDKQCQSGVCNGSGTCSVTAKTGSCTLSSDAQCGPGLCKSGACTPMATSCTENVDPKCQVGICTAAGGCMAMNTNEGNSCSTNPCQPATCKSGQCLPGASQEGQSCSKDLCNPATCVSGQCTKGQVVTCPNQECFVNGGCDSGTGKCKYTYYGDGQPCGGTSSYCFNGGVCTNMTCSGTPKVDCSSLNGQCTTGVCDETLMGKCVAKPKDPGTACTPDGKCQVGTSCQPGGVCGTGKTCPSTTGSCMVGQCDPATGGCVNQPRAPGTACDPMNSCLSGGACDANGSCSGQNPLPNGSPCQDATGASGACSNSACVVAQDMAVSTPPPSPDMAHGGAGGKHGCSFGGAPAPAGAGLLLLLLLALAFGRRRVRD